MLNYTNAKLDECYILRVLNYTKLKPNLNENNREKDMFDSRIRNIWATIWYLKSSSTDR